MWAHSVMQPAHVDSQSNAPILRSVPLSNFSLARGRSRSWSGGGGSIPLGEGSTSTLKNSTRKTNTPHSQARSVSLLSQSWVSEFITWDPDEFDGLEDIVLSPAQVWLPSFSLDNTCVFQTF